MISSVIALVSGAKYWIIGGMIVAVGIYIGALKITITHLENENANLNSDKAIYEHAIALAKQEAENRVVYVDKEVEVIKVQTQTKVKTIKEYVKDENKSDCANAIDFARKYF